MTSLNKEELGILDPSTLYIQSGNEIFAEAMDIHWRECRSEIDDFCDDPDHSPRCNVLQNDSDDSFFGYQCNLAYGHNSRHAFGIDSMLWWLGKNSRCTEDEHFGDCPTCWVREVRHGRWD